MADRETRENPDTTKTKSAQERTDTPDAPGFPEPLEKRPESRPGNGYEHTDTPDAPDTPDALGPPGPVPGSDPEPEPEPDSESDAERRRRRAQFLRELNEAKELRDRVQPRRARAARMRQQMRMRTFRW